MPTIGSTRPAAGAILAVPPARFQMSASSGAAADLREIRLTSGGDSCLLAFMRVAKIHPHDVGLPVAAVRKRRRSRRVARWMLTIAILTAVAGWALFGFSVSAAARMRDQPASLAIVAYGVLIVSSVTLVLGLWYLLLAQVERVARMVEGEADSEEEAEHAHRCGNCGWSFDVGDRFCRHCGKPLGATIVARPPAPGSG